LSGEGAHRAVAIIGIDTSRTPDNEFRNGLLEFSSGNSALLFESSHGWSNLTAFWSGANSTPGAALKVDFEPVVGPHRMRAIPMRALIVMTASKRPRSGAPAVIEAALAERTRDSVLNYLGAPYGLRPVTTLSQDRYGGFEVDG
jgi:hypothetical protein